MHIAEFKTINQILDYLLALITNTVVNIRLDSSIWRSDIFITKGKWTIGKSQLVKKLFTFVLQA